MNRRGFLAAAIAVALLPTVPLLGATRHRPSGLIVFQPMEWHENPANLNYVCRVIARIDGTSLAAVAWADAPPEALTVPSLRHMVENELRDQVRKYLVDQQRTVETA